MEIVTIETPSAIVGVGYDANGAAWASLVPCRAPEVGAFGDNVRAGARALARSRVARGIAKVAVRAAQATPYGRVATGVVRAARGAVRRSARELQNASPRELAAAAQEARSPLSDADARMVLRAAVAAKIPPSALARLAVEVSR